MPRFVVCTAIVGAMVFGLYGCAKEAEQAETTEEAPVEEVATTPAMAPSVAGTYMAEVGAADAAQKITMTLNADNTATMMVEYMSGQPAMSQTGTWAMGEMENAVNFMYGSEGATMTVPMMVSGNELKVGGDMATALGVTEINLVKQEAAAAPAEGSAEEGHSH
jgi:hypothetical protein